MNLSCSKADIPVVLLEGVHPKAAEHIVAQGYTNTTVRPDTPADSDLHALLKDARILGIRSRTKVTKELLDAAPHLIAIGCFCIGTNQVDLTEAAKRGIPVFNAPFSSTRSVAELTIGSIIALLRGVPQKNSGMHKGVWRKSAKGSHEVRGKTVGIIGYGNIGTQVGVLANALGMEVRYYDIANKLPLGTATPASSLDELLEVADVITLHVPGTPQTKNMINASILSKIKKGAYIINYARGNVIDIPALDEALQKGLLAGAAVDVFPTEPASNNETFESMLTAHENVLLTPHVGGSTEEAQEGIGMEVAEKLVRYSDNGSTAGAVNFPTVTLPESPNTHRIINIHQNVPGVLSSLNDIFANATVNIAGQFLQTSPEIGYVVTDIETTPEQALALKDTINAITGSIRTRVLH